MGLAMGAENMFRKVFGRKVVGTPALSAYSEAGRLHPALAAELQRLDLIKSGLARKAQSVVLSGDDESFLRELDTLVASVPRYQSPYFKDNAACNDTQGAVDVAMAKGEITDAGMIRRFFAIRLRVRPNTDIHTYKRLGYSDRQMLVKEVFNAVGAGDRRLNHHSSYANPQPALVPTLTPPQVMQLVCDVGGTPVDYFSWAGPEMGSTVDQSRPHFAAGFAALVAGQPEAFAAAFGQLPNETLVLRMLDRSRRCDALQQAPVVNQIVALMGKGNPKAVREGAVSALARMEPSALLAVVTRGLQEGDIETRHGLVQVASQAGTPEILAVLEARAEVEKAAKVQAAIAAILEVNSESIDTPEGPHDGQRERASEQVSYLAITGETVTCPSRIDIGSADVPAPSDEACIGFVDLIPVIEEMRRQRTDDYNKRYNRTGSNANPMPKPIDPKIIESAFATLTRAAPQPPYDPSKINHAELLIRDVRGTPEGQKWLRGLLDVLPIAARLQILTATRHGDRGAIIGSGYAHNPHEVFGVDLMREWLAEGLLDLRDIVGVKELRWGLAGSRNSYGPDNMLTALDALPSDALWPCLAENMEVFDEALGLRPATTTMLLDRVMAVMAMLPAVPQRYLPRLLEIAVTEKRPLRLQAMALLRDAKDLPARIAALLDDKRQPVRINAAGWLADIRSTASEKALRARLKKEKSDPVRAALIIALQRLGADLTDVIGPASLIAEAKAAIAKTPPKLPEWLVKSGVPVVRFRDGNTVPEDVVAHWLALAIRLKDASAHGQFGIYLDQLEADDARALSGWVLESWITYDTTAATLEEATAYAKSIYLGRYAMHGGRYLQGSQLPPDVQAQLIASITREKMGELVNSGSDTKGLLALACRADPVWAAGRVRWFLKKHGRRSNQAMALLEALAGIGAPAALQVVIAASTRLKQKSTQARAAEIAQRYADDRGWSVDELADRTVPAAGFDDDGELDLPCGEDAKPYVARLDAALAIHLFNPDGKVVKALPAGDDDNTKESKKAFTAAKKELAQVIELQATRLFEAMCVERQWPVADWRLAFHQHPVMRRLVERLVWQGLDGEGVPLGLFRPTQEGDFTDAADNDVAIDDFAAVRLAHGALVDAETCAAWTAHLKDYEVKPFLAQFDTLRAPLTPELAEAEAIIDRQGWAADSRTFRGAAEKRGYQRVMRDSGGCHEYVKEFPSHGITATIWHTGSYAVDENLRQALKELKFTKAGHRGVYRLKDVPPVLLAECWADYHAVAAKGALDPEWEKISPW
jgi:Domain of unknown function (DUF4132)